jgi:LDH2 family malate/lactate/ureidoglycolate dehydrogenase
MKIPIERLKSNVTDILKQNFPENEAAIIADYFIWAEMSGNKTQGLLKMTGTEPIQNTKPTSVIKVIRDKKLSQLIDAGANPAPLVSQIASDTVIAKAKEHGFGIVGINNIHTSNGAQAFYAEKIANNDLIGVVLARSSAAAAAFGGIEPVFGTNPIAFSFPTQEEPLVFDMATTAMTWYGLVLAKARGEKIPENVAIDKDGNPTTDPAEAMAGALLSFDRSYKGSGLGMVVEMLGGPLVGASYGQIEGDWGSLFIAIDPDLLIDVDVFKTNSSNLVKKIKGAKTNEGSSIRIPGEKSNLSLAECKASGLVEVDDVILEALGIS